MAIPNPFSSDFASVFIGRYPIYVDGVQIGWFTNNNNVCRGEAQIYTAITADPNWRVKYPPERWMIRDALWNYKPLSAHCLDNGVVPSWAIQRDGKIIAAAPTAAVGTAPIVYQQSGTGFKPEGEDGFDLGDLLPKGNFPVGMALVGGAFLLLLLSRR